MSTSASGAGAGPPVRKPPFAVIRDTLDRSATERLLARLVTGSVRSRRWVVATLSCLRDPRAESTLRAMLRDTLFPEDVRWSADRLLREQDAVSRSEALDLLRSNDPVLRCHAVRSLGHEDVERLRAIADPDDPCCVDALTAMEFGFDHPDDVARRIAGLSHAGSAVRSEAAGCLLWDEPVAAEEALLVASNDAVAAVAAAATNTLRYYRTRRVLLHLERLGRRRGRVGREARSALDELVAAFAAAIVDVRGPARAALDAWTAPVAHLLAHALEEDTEQAVDAWTDVPPAPPAPCHVDASALRRLLDDPSGRWQPKLDLLRQVDACGFADVDRRWLAPWLAGHPDPSVREGAARLLAGWDDRAALLALVRDDRRAVAFTATFALASTTPDAEVAHALLARLDAPGTAGAAASETLRTILVHLPAAHAVSWLTERARSDPRQDVRTGAVWALAERGAADALRSLSDLLAEPPQVTWALHVALIEALHQVGLPLPDVSASRAVDHLDLQVALASCEVPS